MKRHREEIVTATELACQQIYLHKQTQIQLKAPEKSSKWTLSYDCLELRTSAEHIPAAPNLSMKE